MFGTLQAKLILLAVIFFLGLGVGYKWRSYQADKDALEAANKAAAAMTEALSKRDATEASYALKSKNLEGIIADLRVSKQKVQIIREKSYVTNPVYTSCIVPDTGILLLNDSIAERHGSINP